MFLESLNDRFILCKSKCASPDVLFELAMAKLGGKSIECKFFTPEKY